MWALFSRFFVLLLLFSSSRGSLRAQSAGVFALTASTVSKLLAALNECTEWGQIFILDSLAIYEPKDQVRDLKKKKRRERRGEDDHDHEMGERSKPVSPLHFTFSLTRHPLFFFFFFLCFSFIPQRELESICERVTPRLQHVNAAVVLSAVKVCTPVSLSFSRSLSHSLALSIGFNFLIF
jgi:hypothetical protein